MITKAKLLIDQDCPMCKAYGNGFIKAKLIDQETLKPYQQIEHHYTTKVDMDRARNEIALVLENQTLYGIDALIRIVAQNKPKLSQLLHKHWIYKPLNTLYHFISYNRKLIYPVKPTLDQKTCNPDVHLAYRYAYIILVALITGFILNHFSQLLFKSLNLYHHPAMEWIMCFGQIVWQGLAIQYLHKEKRLDYLGNMSTVSLIGGVLVALTLLLQLLITLSPFVLLLVFASIVCLMLYEHIRRCKLLGISILMTISWVVYRSIFLIIIMYIQ